MKYDKNCIVSINLIFILNVFWFLLIVLTNLEENFAYKNSAGVMDCPHEGAGKSS
jgi:hypothetical protein